MKLKKEIKSVVFIGSGNVATHLSVALHKMGMPILQIYSPNIEHARLLARKTESSAIHDLSEINPEADLYLISIPDDKIIKVIDELKPFSGIAAHTSGIVEMKVLEKFENFGVFYPLQTFSKNRPVDITTVPFCIEGNSEDTQNTLFDLAKKLSRSVQYINSVDRKQIHLAAVFVNNFPNHLYAAAENLLKEKNISFEILLPLLQETAAKMQDLKPEEAQTGPARRNDLNTIKTHSAMLKNHPELLEIYQLFSHQILKKYHDKL
ncbi:MAG: DUF2520 domain-containing protein [Bacteroidales bacterium]|nr:DUF2520 domain-containing protein [Bacteroidales bacterium]